MSVWNDIRKKSLGQEQRGERVEPLINQLSDRIIELVRTHNDLVSEYNGYVKMINSYNSDGANWPFVGYQTVNFFSPDVATETLKTLDVNKLRSLTKNLYLKIYNLKTDVSNIKVSCTEARKIYLLRQQEREEEQKRRDEEKEQERIKEKNRKSVTFVVVFSRNFFGYPMRPERRRMGMGRCPRSFHLLLTLRGCRQ